MHEVSAARIPAARERPRPGHRLVDLSHVLDEGMPVPPGLPAPVFGAVVSHRESRDRYDGKAEFYLGKAEIPGNLGTHLEAPFHRFAHLEDLSRVPLDAVAGLPGLVADSALASRAVSVRFAESIRGRAVLIRTGWADRWGTGDYWVSGPYIAEEFVDRLVRGGPSLVGVDFPTIDDLEDNARPAHTRLLREGILVVENLCNLSALPDGDFRFFAVPPAIVRGAAFPVRAFAEIPPAAEDEHPTAVTADVTPSS